MADTVSVKIKIDDAGSFKKVDVDAKDLRKAIREVKEETNRLNAEVINFAQRAQSFSALQSAIGSLQGAFANLTSGYIEGQTQMARLEQVMRNTMDASQGEIQAIEALCDAQQRLGVTSKEAQLAGAQELATYLELPSSLQTLIPVLNDMAAQQLGIGASGESVAQIATMLGKVMEGQTKALSRYGYSFSEAQEYVLQFGEENERAAVLAEVIGASVGGVAQSVKNSVGGTVFQVEQWFDEVKESIGSLVARAMPLINSLASIANAANGIFQLSAALQAVNVQAVITRVRTVALSVAIKVQDMALKMCGLTARTCASAMTRLRIATAALYAAMSLGLTVAITALISLFSKLAGRAEEAAQGIEDVNKAERAYTNASAKARAEIGAQIVEIEDLIKKKKDEKKKVEELNTKYGEVFGHYKTLSQWYDTLQTKSAAYCRQLGYQARAEALISENGEDYVALDETRKQMVAMRAAGKATRGGVGKVSGADGKTLGWTIGEHNTPKYQELVEQEYALTQAIKGRNVQIEESTTEARKAAEALSEMTTAGSGDPGGKDGKSKPKTMADDIKEYRESVLRAVEVNKALEGGYGSAAVEEKAMESGLTSLIKKYGLETEAIQELISEYQKLKRERGAALLSGGPAMSEGTANILSGVGARTGKDIERNKQPSWQKSATYASDLAIPYDKTPEGAKEKLEEYQKALDKAKQKQEEMQQGVGAIASAFGSLAGVVGEAAGKWLEWAGNLLQAVAQAIPAIVKLTTAKKAEATANAAAAVTGGAESVASTPYVGAAMAVAAAANIIAAFANMPKFAAGALAYGPTIGLFGEYAGAATNPEVIAPLSKLKGLINDGSGFPSRVDFRIQGRDLYGIMRKESNLKDRS